MSVIAAQPTARHGWGRRRLGRPAVGAGGGWGRRSGRARLGRPGQGVPSQFRPPVLRWNTSQSDLAREHPVPLGGPPDVGWWAMSATASTQARLQSGEQSAERVRDARQATPRWAHGEWVPAPDRPDPIAVLSAEAATRVQELVPIRYGRMLVSPFTFYRGAAAVMAADLAATPDSGIVVQACGDAHISNFGGFAAPDRRLVFGPNDFDETLPGAWEWDVKRMAASVEIAGRDVGLPADRRRRLVTACVREYREGMRGFAQESHLDVWYERINASELVERFGGKLGNKGRIEFAKPFAQARRKTSVRAVSRLTETVHGELRFRSVPPLLVPLRELFDPAHPHGEAEYVRELLHEC